MYWTVGEKVYFALVGWKLFAIAGVLHQTRLVIKELLDFAYHLSGAIGKSYIDEATEEEEDGPVGDGLLLKTFYLALLTSAAFVFLSLEAAAWYGIYRLIIWL